MNSLNPVVRVEGQFRDVIEYHTELRGDAVLDRIKTLFDMVFIDHKFITAYPHELSGGMKQRVNLALALAIEPRFVLLDEPTTGLDVVVQHDILENVRKLQTELGFAVLFISHDIGTVLDLSDRILVMYAGKIVEEQQADLLLRDPMHPYTKGLLGSYGDPRDETVRITYVPGRPPDLAHRPAGCSFAPRCPEKIARCTTIEPPLEALGRRPGRLSRRQDRSAAMRMRDGRGRGRPDHPGVHRPAVRQVGERVRGGAASGTRADASTTSPRPSSSAAGPKVTRTEAVEERELRAAPRRGDRAGRAERQREVDPGPDDHRRGPADGGHDHLPRLARRRRRRRDARAAAARLPQPRADGLPGPVLRRSTRPRRSATSSAGRW